MSEARASVKPGWLEPVSRSGEKLRITDAHVNVASTRYIPRRFVEDQAANTFTRFEAMGERVPRARVYDMVFALYEDHMADRLVAEMDRSGITDAILLAPDFSHVAECELTVEELALAHRDIARRHPGRFHVFIGADPRHGASGVDFFERCIDEFQFAGLKLYPPCGYSPSDPGLYPYYEVCAARGLPVLTHTGPGWQALDFGFGNPMLIDEAARLFPGVNFILGHGGVTYVEECSYLCMYRPNVHMDVSGFTSVMNPNGWQVHLNELFHTGINHKIVFGTSWPAFKMSTTLSRLMAGISMDQPTFANVKRADVKRIMGGNVRRLLPKVNERVEVVA